MKAFHHPYGNQQALRVKLAHLYNLISYQPTPSAAADGVWKSKAAKSPHMTGSSTSKSSPREAFDE
jgi:hypothetical protein